MEFIRNKYPGYCSLITFYQLVKALNMDYNEFKEKLYLMTRNENEIRKLWNEIKEGKKSYREIAKDYFEKKKGKDHSMYEVIDPFLKIVYKIQTGLDVDEMLDTVKSYKNDLIQWDPIHLNHWFDLFNNTNGKTNNEVPFLTEFFSFPNFKFMRPEHIFIQTAQMKTPGGKFHIKEYNSDEDKIREYESDTIVPLMYGLISKKEDLEKKFPYSEIKAGNI